MTVGGNADRNEVLRKVLALRDLTDETGMITRRAQNQLLQTLSDTDLAWLAEQLTLIEQREH